MKKKSIAMGWVKVTDKNYIHELFSMLNIAQ